MDMRRIRIHIDHIIVDGNGTTSVEGARNALMQELSKRFEAGVPQNLEKSFHRSLISVQSPVPAGRSNWPASVAQAIVGDMRPNNTQNTTNTDKP